MRVPKTAPFPAAVRPAHPCSPGLPLGRQHFKFGFQSTEEHRLNSAPQAAGDIVTTLQVGYKPRHRMFLACTTTQVEAVEARNPAPRVLETSKAAPSTASVREFKSTLNSQWAKRKFSYRRVSAFICGPMFFRGLAFTYSLSPPFLPFSSTSRSNSPPSTTPSRIIQPAVKPGRADRRSLVNPRQRNSGAVRKSAPGRSGLAAPETLRKGRDTEENRFSG